MSIRKVSLGKVSRYRLPFFVAMVSVLSLVGSSGIARAAQDAAQPASSAAPRIVEHVDENHLATLTGNMRPEARAEFDRGPVESNLRMGDLILVLRRGPEQQAAFDALLASQQDPSSPNYHRWLTPDQIGQRFGPAQADLETISQWLRNQGFSIDNISKDRLLIRFSGNAGQVESAFHTEIHNLQVRGENHIANMSDPKIPQALTPVVVGINALHNFFPKPMHRLGGVVRRNSQGGGWTRIASSAEQAAKQIPPAPNARQVKPLFGTGGTTSGEANIEDVAPYDFATIYNVLPLWTASTPISGAGQTIAIAGTSNINPADITTFRAAFGLPAYTASNAPVVKFGNTDPGDCPTFAASCQSDLVENTLDVEWSGAIAPGAQIILVASTATTPTTDPLLISEQFIVDNVTAPIMNVSYGECELGLGTENATYNSLWSTAQMAGIAVFVSTGDSGSASCDDGGDVTNGVPYGAQFGLSVSGVASTPYDTAVGGTDFAWGWVNNGASQSTYWASSNNATTQASALGYIPEFPWNSTCTNPLLDALFNSELKESLTAAEICDDIGTGGITSTGGSLLGLVDTVGGSGGPSNCINGNGSTVASCSKGYPKPSWQANVTGIPNDNVRDIPDLSFFAASGFSGSAYVICVSAAGTCSYTAATEPTGEEVGGTSVASPIMAAVAALINQKAGAPQGNLNTLLYKLAASETYSGCSTESIPLTGSSCVFNDIDTGTIAMPCDVGSPDCPSTTEVDFSELSGYPATVGYDVASGLGSINVANLVKAYAAAIAPAVSFSPTSLTFASTAEGTTATTQSITLQSTGGSALAISGISITGTDASSFSETTTCSTTTSLAVGASCNITVAFAPAAAGSLTASVSVADNASGSPQTVTLTGTGAEVGTYSLSAAAVTVAPGSSGPSAITASGSGGYVGPNTITLSNCTLATSPTGATDAPTCTISNATVTFVSGSASGAGGTVNIGTTAPTSSVRRGQLDKRSKTWPWAGAGGIVLGCLLFFGIPARQRNWRSLLGVLLFAGILGVLSGCGGGSSGGGGGGNSGTTPGSYTFTVTGTDAGGAKQTATINVTVS